jgi:hypothetical protein
VLLEEAALVEKTLEQRLDELLVEARRSAAAAKVVAKAAGALEKDASLGSLKGLRPGLERLTAAAEQLADASAATRAAWNWSENDEEEYLREGYLEELRSAAEQQSVPLHRYGKAWSASPLLVRIDPKGRAIVLDRKRRSDLRPSRIVAAIVAARQQRSSLKPEAFLESLLEGYRTALGRQLLAGQPVREGVSIPLTEIHHALTPLPESRKDYPVEAFARDLYLLDKSGLHTTKSGLRLYLAASTSTKGGGGVLTVLDDAGRPFHYFSAAFRSESHA